MRPTGGAPDALGGESFRAWRAGVCLCCLCVGVGVGVATVSPRLHVRVCVCLCLLRRSQLFPPPLHVLRRPQPGPHPELQDGVRRKLVRRAEQHSKTRSLSPVAPRCVATPVPGRQTLWPNCRELILTGLPVKAR